MSNKLLSGFIGIATLCGLFCGLAGCRGNAPGKQDDVTVRAPGVIAKSDDQGVSVKAPLGVEVSVDQNGVAVKAPFVDVKADPSGVSVQAPGVSVKTGDTDKPNADSAKAP